MSLSSGGVDFGATGTRNSHATLAGGAAVALAGEWNFVEVTGLRSGCRWCYTSPSRSMLTELAFCVRQLRRRTDKIDGKRISMNCGGSAREVEARGPDRVRSDLCR